MKKGMIKPAGALEGAVHWGLAFSCLLLCVTGMGMMYHSLSFIGEMMGGMLVLKYVHNFSGLFFVLALLFTPWLRRKGGIFSLPEDLEWVKAGGGRLWQADNMPETGRRNHGRKIFSLAVLLYGLIMIGSGLIMWFPRDFSIGLVRAMFVLHALGFVLILPFFFAHLYLVIMGAPGSAPAMFAGWMAIIRAWARQQHPNWLKDMKEDGTLVVFGEEKSAGGAAIADSRFPGRTTARQRPYNPSSSGRSPGEIPSFQ
jgi:formate dehydrogenase subunit gamma